jgi:hypothetical protein
MKRQAIVPDETIQALSKALAAHRRMGEHLRNAIRAAGGVLDESGDIVGGCDNTTQQPSRSNPYAWMSVTMQKFYKRQDRLHKLDKDLASIDPNSNFGRQLKAEREAQECELDLARLDNWKAKSDLHARWSRKDPCAQWPVWRSVDLYGKQTPDPRREKDPWASRRLV